MKIDGEKVKKIRLSLGKSQEEFGQLFNPPAPKSTVCRWEKGCGARKGRLKKIAKLAGIPVESLYPGLLTEKQKDCPYCHGAKNLLRSNDGQPVDGNIVYINDNGYLNLKTDYEHVYRKINYCPMCGRPLNKN